MAVALAEWMDIIIVVSIIATRATRPITRKIRHDLSHSLLWLIDFAQLKVLNIAADFISELGSHMCERDYFKDSLATLEFEGVFIEAEWLIYASVN